MAVVELKKRFIRELIATLLLVLFASGALAYLILENREQLRANITLGERLLEREGEFFETKKDLEYRIAILSGTLASTTDERNNLETNLIAEQNRNEVFEGQIREITGTVGKLDKLSKTDPELLQKYSKVFFLNEHYTPPKLREIDKKYVYDETKSPSVNADVYPFFERMVERAKRDDIDLWVISAFRSFGEQAQLKGNYLVTFGTGANAFSADQGYSEHQLGTTIDFTTSGISGSLRGFETTEAYTWLLENAHKYGFTLSYPSDNAYYIFEPWHWRFVGEGLAEYLYDEDLHFYDLDQRKIDSFLIEIFD